MKVNDEIRYFQKFLCKNKHEFSETEAMGRIEKRDYPFESTQFVGQVLISKDTEHNRISPDPSTEEGFPDYSLLLEACLLQNPL